MGWTTMPLSSMGGHRTAKAYLDANFTCERTLEDGTVRAQRVLASSCTRNQIYHAAVRPSTDGVAEPVFAIVCLVRWNPRDRDGYVFGCKEMTENMGPCEAECPEHILELLEPTDSPEALLWRKRCFEALRKRRRPLENGMHIRLRRSMRFTDGHEGRDFVVYRRGRAVELGLIGESYARYRLRHLRSLDWVEIPHTCVHKTLFEGSAACGKEWRRSLP